MISPPINEKEFASIIKQHSGIINKVSYFYASPKMPFDDLRQEIYVNIWLGLEQFRNDSKISTWIYRVAVNSALMALRSSKSKVKPYRLISDCLTYPQKSTMYNGRIFKPFAL